VLPLVGSTIVPPAAAAGLLGLLHHAQRDAVLHAAAGVDVLHLGQTVAAMPSVTLFRRTRGVLPIISTTLSK
jgi:hypothetical protein